LEPALHAFACLACGPGPKEGTLPPEVIAPRIAAMLGTLDILDTREPGVQEGKFNCADW